MVLNMFILVDQIDLADVWFRVGSVSLIEFSGVELTVDQRHQYFYDPKKKKVIGSKRKYIQQLFENNEITFPLGRKIFLYLVFLYKK